jgi:hypothetical protein
VLIVYEVGFIEEEDDAFAVFFGEAEEGEVLGGEDFLRIHREEHYVGEFQGL